MEIQHSEQLQNIKNLIRERELPINLERLDYVWNKWQELGLDVEILTRFIEGITFYSFKKFKESLHKMFAAIDEHIGEDNFILITIAFDGERNSTAMMSRLLELKYGKRIKAILNQHDLNKNRFDRESDSDFPFNIENYKGEKVVYIDDWSLSGENSQLGSTLRELIENSRKEVIVPNREDILLTAVGLSEASEEYIKESGFKYFTPNPIINHSTIATSKEDHQRLVSNIPERYKRDEEDIHYILSEFMSMYSVVSFYKVPDNFNGLFRRKYYQFKDNLIPYDLENLWLVNDTEEHDIEPRIYPFYKEIENYDDILLKLISE